MRSIVATFDDGTTERADVLIGADGVHSVVRRLIDPVAPAGRYVGLTNFGGITLGGATSRDIEPETWQFVFGRRAFFGYHATPNGDVVWFVNAPRAPIGAGERATRRPKRGAASWLACSPPTVAPSSSSSSAGNSNSPETTPSICRMCRRGTVPG